MFAQERPNLVEEFLKARMPADHTMIVAWQLDEARARDQAGGKATFLDRNSAVAAAVEDECRGADGCGVFFGVHLRIHLQDA